MVLLVDHVIVKAKAFLFFIKSIIYFTNLQSTAFKHQHKGGSRSAATSKMERFVIIVNGWKPLTIITNRSILDVAAVLDPPDQQASYETK